MKDFFSETLQGAERKQISFSKQTGGDRAGYGVGSPKVIFMKSF